MIEKYRRIKLFYVLFYVSNEEMIPFGQKAFERQCINWFPVSFLSNCRAFGVFFVATATRNVIKETRQGQVWKTETTLNIFKAPLSSSSVKRSALPNCGYISQRRKREADSRGNFQRKFHRTLSYKTMKLEQQTTMIDCRFPLLEMQISPRIITRFPCFFLG